LDAAVLIENHLEREVLRSAADEGVSESPTIPVTELQMKKSEGLGLGDFAILVQCTIKV
jgi:hypothetical protein